MELREGRFSAAFRANGEEFRVFVVLAGGLVGDFGLRPRDSGEGEEARYYLKLFTSSKVGEIIWTSQKTDYCTSFSFFERASPCVTTPLSPS